MKVVLRYLKSSKVLRFLSVFFSFSLVLTLFFSRLIPKSEMGIQASCERSIATKDRCVFNCSLEVEKNATGRLIVVHSGWAAIFDEEFYIVENQTKFIEIELPKRNYTYYLRGGFFNEEKYGILEKRLFC